MEAPLDHQRPPPAREAAIAGGRADGVASWGEPGGGVWTRVVQIEGSATAAPVAQSVKRTPSAHSRSRAKNVDIPSTSFARIIRLGVHFA